MKERPILFSAPMVRALLDGSKTQTRRAIKCQPEPPRAIYNSIGADTKITPNLLRCENGMGVAWRFEMSKIASDKDLSLSANFIDHEPVRIVCPYGNPGDQLWVRETWQAVRGNDRARRICTEARPDVGWIEYAATPRPDEPAYKWRPSIHMPRWASRILLEVTDVRVERLQDISEADAVAEGSFGWAGEQDTPARDLLEARLVYRQLWEEINGTGAWDANPWVWVVSFKRVTP